MTFVSLRHAHWGQVIITWQVKISSQILLFFNCGLQIRLLRYHTSSCQQYFFYDEYLLQLNILNLSQILYLFFNCDTFSYCLQNHTHYPLSDLQPEILRLLSCNHGNTSSCQQSLYSAHWTALIQTHWQTDTLKNRQTDGHTDRHTDRQTDTLKNRQTDRHTDRQTHWLQ